MKRFMKKTALLLSIFFVGLFSCSSKSAKESKSISIGGLISKDESAQTSKSIPLEKVPLSYEDENLFLYTFTQEQSAKLVEINRRYSGISITAKISIPANIDLTKAVDSTFPVKFCLFDYELDKENTKPASVMGVNLYSYVQIPDSFAGRTVKVSLCLPRLPTGFALQAVSGVTMSDVKIEQSSIGWCIEDGIMKYAFGPNGGTLYTNFSNIDFSSAIDYFPSGAGAAIYVLYKERSAAASQSKIYVAMGNEKVLVRYNASQKVTVLQTAAFENPLSNISLSDISDISGVLLKAATADSKGLIPILSDPGLIIDWNPSKWRNADYEVFSWEEFPNVLIFDTKDYAVQDNFFKRLAFFAEKKGYKGTLAPDSKISNLHGFNALDYRTSVIANFFNKATVENFPLNNYEVLLKNIMLKNGLLLNAENGMVKPGAGAIISISRESPYYLRWQFINHEGYHGIYFTHNEFLQEVNNVYNSIDRTSLEFIKTYYTISPELNYDINDQDLMQNELMAYTMQHRIDRVASYYLGLANRSHVRKNARELSDYVISTNAVHFVSLAKELDDFVFKNYGLNAGRVYLVERCD